MAQKNQNLKLKELKELALMKETLFTFQQKHSIHMDPLIERRNFHILQSTYYLKKMQHTKQLGMNLISETKLQKLFKNNVNKGRFKN